MEVTWVAQRRKNTQCLPEADDEFIGFFAFGKVCCANENLQSKLLKAFQRRDSGNF